MNERRAIEAINLHPLYRVEVGSKPKDITPTPTSAKNAAKANGNRLP